MYGCELTLGMYICTNEYVCVYIGTKTYLLGNHLFSLTSIKSRFQIKISAIKKFLSHLLESSGYIVLLYFYVQYMDCQKSVNRNFHPCICTRGPVGEKQYIKENRRKGSFTDGTRGWRTDAKGQTQMGPENGEQTQKVSHR